jgi:hypothetical protein
MKDIIFQLSLGTYIVLNYIFLIQNKKNIFNIYFRKLNLSTGRDLPMYRSALTQRTLLI